MSDYDEDEDEFDGGPLASAVRDLALAVTAHGIPGMDATGGSVGSVTEALMGVTGGLVQIAEAITGLAEAVREYRK